MPLVAVDNQGLRVVSVDIPEEEWDRAKGLKKECKPEYTFPLCGQKAIMKTSKLGLQHFAHYGTCDHDHPHETPEHLTLKALAVKAIRLIPGWEAEPEVMDAGRLWVADVMATHKSSGVRVAVEVQWTQQPVDKYRQRTSRYASSGVRTLWLRRHKITAQGFVSHPVKLSKDMRSAYSRNSTLEEVLNAELERYQQEGPPRLRGALSVTAVHAFGTKCWKCSKEGTLVYADPNARACPNCNRVDSDWERDSWTESPLENETDVRALAQSVVDRHGLAPIFAMQNRFVNKVSKNCVVFCCPECDQVQSDDGLRWNWKEFNERHGSKVGVLSFEGKPESGPDHVCFDALPPLGWPIYVRWHLGC